MSSNRPILIGAAQFSVRDAELATAPSPLDMLARIARESAESAGGDAKLLSRIDTIGLTNIIGWTPQNPPAIVADAIGAAPRHLISSAVGGETSIGLTNEIAQRVTRGDSELAFVAGCNNMRTMGLSQNAGQKLDWPTGGSGTPTPFGKDRWGSSDAENAVGLNMPISIYPLFENALRAARGQSLEEHRVAMGEMFSTFSKVASENPHAWFPTARSATELVTTTEINRMIGFPYTKYLNAVMATDQAAGVLLASEDCARRLGIPESNWIYWRGGALEIEEPWYMSERPSFSTSPALAKCHQSALASAGVSLSEIDLFDFYSCFPAAVSIACEMLGLAQDDPRGLTLTGGLPYAGGPGNSYSLHGLASAVTALRVARGDHALVTGNGWYLTKHSAVVLSREAGPAQPNRPTSPTTTRTSELEERAGFAAPDWSEPPVAIVKEANGAATVETYTIVHGRDGRPEQGIVIARTDAEGERFLANTPADPDLLEALETRELVGARGDVSTTDSGLVFDLSSS